MLPKIQVLFLMHNNDAMVLNRRAFKIPAHTFVPYTRFAMTADKLSSAEDVYASAYFCYGR